MALDASTAYDTAPLRPLSRTILLLLLLLLTSRATAEPIVTLVTVGPGDAVWEKFGHNMLRVEDPDRRNPQGRPLDVCFNWGLFDFDQPNFIRNFVRGRMLYTMAPMDTAKELAEYQEQNRRVTFQRLRLSPEQADVLVRRCVDNFRNTPDYRYDYFKDNCSTRVRDMLDVTLGGELAKASRGVPASPPMTYRRAMLRLMRDDFWLSIGMDFAAGPETDKPLDHWALGFLPATVSEMALPFADAPTEVWTSTRPLPPTAPLTTWPWLLAAGVIGAGLIVCFTVAATPASPRAGPVRSSTPVGTRDGLARGDAGVAATRGHSARFAGFIRTTLVYVWWLLAGLGGAFMIYMWTATDHTAAHANQNLWHFSPLAWLALVLHVIRQWAAVVWFTRAMVGMALVGCIVWAAGKLFGGPIAQPNGNFILLSLPLNLAAAWATRLPTTHLGSDEAGPASAGL